MQAKVYVEGFPSSVSAEELANLFSAFGTVVSAEVAKTETGGSLRYAQIEMASPEAAGKAVEVLHRIRIGGQLVLVFHDVWPGSTMGGRSGRSRATPEDSLL